MTQKTIVHVNRLQIAMNAKDGGKRHQYVVRRPGKDPIYAQAVECLGRTTFVDPRANPPLSCGARAWAEVDGDVMVVEPATFQEARALGAA